MSKIKTERAMTMASKKSSIALGNGTMIIAKIAITKKTTLRSREAKSADNTVLMSGVLFFALAKCYSSNMASRVSVPKKASTFPCNRFKNGQIPQLRALFDGQSSAEGEQLKTAGLLPSAASITSNTVISRG